MLTALANLILAARYYLQIKAAHADYDLTLRIERDCLEIETSIEALRARGDPSAQLLADQLRARLLRAQGIALALSAARPAFVAEPAGADKGRDSHPAVGGSLAQ